MTNQIKSELNVLDRILYLLEERSVYQLRQENAAFDNFIGSLYKRVETRTEKFDKASQ